MERHYDVIIVGAGPAGGAAAYHSATAGFSTLLLDRKRFPRSKVCGDGLTPRALRALARMNLGSVADESLPIRGIRFTRGTEAGELLFAREPPPFNFGLVIPRLLLDDRIRCAAQAAGAEFQEAAQAMDLSADKSGGINGVWVQTLSGLRLCTSAVTILADGANGRLGRKLRGDGRTGASFRGFAIRQYLAGIEDLGPYFEIHSLPPTQGQVLEGYAWVFPVAQGLANVGVGILDGGGAGRTTSIAALFSEFVSTLALTDHRFAHATLVGSPEGGPLNTRMVDPRVLPARVLCVGDAGGLVNPFTGEGIAYALESGELAARAVRQTLRGPGSHASSTMYARALVTEHGRLWRLRASPRHLGWLLSNSLPQELAQEPSRILDAVRNVVLDQVRVPSDGSLAWARRNQQTTSFLADVRRRIASRLQRIDALLAELVRELASAEDSRALFPLVVATQVAEPRTLRDPIVRRGLLAVALFALAASVLEQTRDATDRDADGDNALAITVGDCLITEANAVAAQLPQVVYQCITTAVLTASRAHVRGSSPAANATSLRRHYEALAAPAVAAISLMIETSARPTGYGRATLECVEWYARTSRALCDLLENPSAELAEYVRTEIDGMVPGTESTPQPLQALVQRLREAGRASLGMPVAADRPA